MAMDLAVTGSRELRAIELPALIAAAGTPAATAFRDFFFGEIANEHTQRAYSHAVELFLDWAKLQALELVQIRPGDVGVYLKQHTGAASTKKLHRSAIKRFFDLLVERHVCLINPAASAKTEKLRVTQGVTPEIERDEVRTLLASLVGTSIGQIRDRAAVGILVYTACRVGAIAKLRRGDFRGRPGQMSLRFHEKGGNHKEVEVRHDLELWLNEYIESAKIKTAQKDTPLFRTLLRREKTLQAKPMTAGDVGRMVKRKLRHAGLREELSAHSFRVATITDLISQGVDIASVQELAGHADARTTKLYDRTNRKATRNLVERISF